MDSCLFKIYKQIIKYHKKLKYKIFWKTRQCGLIDMPTPCINCDKIEYIFVQRKIYTIQQTHI